MTLEEWTLMWCIILSGGEGETCLRTSDCLEGLCCARHFWSRICKPVLTEGQVCTRHRRKGAHGLEIFQRCDCGSGLSCRGQREKPGAESRNLHTCQPRWPRRTALGSTHTHTHTARARMQTHMQRRQRKTDCTEGCAIKRTDRISWTDAEKLHLTDVSVVHSAI